MERANRKFIAILDQSSTSNPTVKATLQNDFGAITISRVSQGKFRLTCPNFFSAKKAVFFATHNSLLSSSYRFVNGGVIADPNSNYRIDFEMLDKDGVAQDAFTGLQIMVIEFQKVKQ